MWESEDKQHTPNVYASIMRLRETRPSKSINLLQTRLHASKSTFQQPSGQSSHTWD